MEQRNETMSIGHARGHSETCEEQLRRMCKNIAENITDGGQIGGVHDFMEGVYDIEWITHNDKSYKAARLLVAGGGPNIWVCLLYTSPSPRDRG